MRNRCVICQTLMVIAVRRAISAKRSALFALPTVVIRNPICSEVISDILRRAFIPSCHARHSQSGIHLGSVSDGSPLLTGGDDGARWPCPIFFIFLGMTLIQQTPNCPLAKASQKPSMSASSCLISSWTSPDIRFSEYPLFTPT